MPFNQGGFNAGAATGMSPLQEEVSNRCDYIHAYCAMAILLSTHTHALGAQVLAAFRDGVGDQGEDIAHVIAKLGSRGRNAQQIRSVVQSQVWCGLM